MAEFDVAGARKAGYSDAEIADHLARSTRFDVAAARKAGYDDAELVDHLNAKITARPATSAESKARADADKRTASTPAIVRAINKGGTFGFSDELDAASAALETGAHNAYNRVTGKPSVGYGMGDAYKAVMDSQAAQDGKFAQDHPIQNVGAQLAGGLATGKVGLKYIQQAPGFLSATARSAQVGAGLGAVAGAGNGRGLADRAKGAAAGAASGAALGAFVPAAVKTVQAIPAAVRSAGSAAAATGQQVAQNLGHEAADAVVTPEVTKRAEQYVAQLAAQAKLTPELLEAHPALAVGEPITTAEAIGRRGIGQATALARRTGATGDLADGILTQRVEGAPDRILGHVAQVAKVSPEGATGGVDAIVEAGRARAKPLYDVALSHPGPVMTPELASIAQRPVVRKAISAVAEDILNEGGDPTAAGIIKRTVRVPGGGTRDTYDTVKAPTAETWDAVHKAIGRQVERHPLTGKALPDSQAQGNYGVGQAARSLTNELRKTVPGYAEALNASGDYLSVQGAFNRTSGTLLSTKTTPSQFERLWGTWKSDGEKSAARDALAADIYNKAQNGQLRPGQLMAPAVKAKLATAFGSDAAEEIIKRVRLNARLNASGNRMRPGINSVTSEAMLGADDTDNALQSGLMKGAGHLATGRPMKAAEALISSLAAPVRGAMTPIDQATRDEVGRILMQSPQETAAMLRARNIQPRSTNPLAVRK